MEHVPLLDRIMNEALPSALMMGVDYELFWTLNPKSLSAFIKAFDLKKKYDDSLAWQHGYYVRMAIGSAMSKETKYPKEPVFFKDTSKQEDAQMSSEEMKRRFLAHAQRINASFN